MLWVGDKIMARRMTWQEIVNNYPDQWVGLTDVERDGASVVSAVVKYTDKTGNELISMQLSGDKTLYSTYTTPDNVPFVYSNWAVKG